MPEAITPTPIPPGSTSYTFNTSGVAPASGVSGVYAGPWAVETQELNIEYYRVPIVTQYPSYTSLTLSGPKAISDTLSTTRLLYKVNATYKMVKSYESFNTSGFSQPQNFEWNADPQDTRGTAYGALTTSANLGPAGTINTVQPFYRRVPWDDTLHTAVTQAVTVANAGLYKGAFVNENAGTTIEAEPVDLEVFFGEMDVSPAKNKIGATTMANDNAIRFVGPAYAIPGAYSPDKESANSIRNFINAVGDHLAGAGFFKIIPTMNTVNSIATRPVADTGVSNYDKSRHIF